MRNRSECTYEEKDKEKLKGKTSKQKGKTEKNIEAKRKNNDHEKQIEKYTIPYVAK